MGRVLTCREVVDLLGDSVSGELAPAYQAAFDRHTASCRSCATYVATYCETIRLAAVVVRSDDSPAQGVPSGFLRAILVAARGQAS